MFFFWNTVVFVGIGGLSYGVPLNDAFYVNQTKHKTRENESNLIYS